jgi:hypothetical protein
MEVEMKYICFGFMDESKWDSMTDAERNEFMDSCFAYDAELRKNGHVVGGEGLQSSRNAATIRFRSGKISVTDGPFIETKEQVGGFMIIEARDLNHAIQLMSNHPSLPKGNIWEIRAIEDISGLIVESERRRATTKMS